VILVAWTTLSSPASAAGLTPETLAAWERYIAHSEGKMTPQSAAGAKPLPPRRPDGVMIDIPGGTIHHWRGSAIARGVTVDQVVRALTYPGSPPPQEDVRESRVLARSGDTLRVYLKLERRAIVTVVYDTEHLVTFSRHSPRLATSRSVATSIAETGGGDRGFLWRLNSYWRYTQVDDDVRIDVESISLSRDVPRVVRPVAGPIVARVARESLVRTLESVRTFLERQDVVGSG
jgi:hypothetical protein